MKSLVITADDFGAAKEVNDAVETAHRHGVLTAASLMVTGAAAADAVARAKAMPSLRVGLHLVLVDGTAALPVSQVASLVRGGRFDSNMARAGAAMFFRPKARRELAREIEAQFQAFAATGLALDHVNTHKHFHLHPTIAALTIAIGRRYGMKALRVPFETDHWPARLLRRRYRAQGLLVPDRVYGLRRSGAMTEERLAAILRTLPDGLSEIYLHPATGAYPGSAPGYRYAEELQALQAVEIPKDFRRGGFADFATAK
ncbi:MAG: hopanoid biosynthesis-associated protein HpnK [Alphaproteobacteria bacterium]|nr:hopanoid biosynthesis-associated protein HpnK [Alphaproteobacteria bacterium]